MTPAPISVERLPEKWRRPPTKAGVEWIEANARRQCAYELEQALPALLQQLAEARILIEDAGSALRVMIATAKAARWPITAGQMVPLNMARQEVRRIAAFLAASGGSNDAL